MKKLYILVNDLICLIYILGTHNEIVHYIALLLVSSCHSVNKYSSSNSTKRPLTAFVVQIKGDNTKVKWIFKGTQMSAVFTEINSTLFFFLLIFCPCYLKKIQIFYSNYFQLKFFGYVICHEYQNIHMRQQRLTVLCTLLILNICN